MLKTVIVDDNVESIELIEGMLSSIPNIHVIKTYTDSTVAIKEIPFLKIDLLFLDIEMPEINGIELIQRLPNIDFDFVFVTGYTKYAIEAFELSAIHYVIKPFKKENLNEIIKRLSCSNNKTFSDIPLNTLSHNLTNENKKLVIKKLNEYLVVDFDDIIFIEVSKDYLEIYTSTEKAGIYGSLIRFIEFANNCCDNQFVRINGKTAVNINYIQKISTNKTEVYLSGLKNGNCKHISDHYKKDLWENFVEFLNK